MKTILTINSGSSSLKASLFKGDEPRRNFRYEQIGHGLFHDHKAAFDALLNELGNDHPDAVGHRFVHGGDIVDVARQVDEEEFTRLNAITHLAPLHMPGNLLGVELCRQRFNVPQIACFDTAFHANMPALAKRLPLPQELGFRRYGFHGLNYAHVARVLPEIIGETAHGKVVVAHLGSGSSLCLMENLQSIDTTMGYTPAGGIPMGTRSGDLDPGIMVELAKRYPVAELEKLVFNHMGLLALSHGESNEMAELLISEQANAKFAVDYFCHQVCAAIGSLAAKAGGLNALVFTAGIGEHAPIVRAKICEKLGFIGIVLDHETNQSNQTMISIPDAKPVLVIPADEESVIRDLTLKSPQNLPIAEAFICDWPQTWKA